MKLSKEQTIAEHRKMWYWIAEQYRNGNTRSVSELKMEYCKKHNLNPLCGCFCCDYNHQKQIELEGEDDYEKCQYCPVLWGTETKEGVDAYFCEHGIIDESSQKSTGLWLIAENNSLQGNFKLCVDICEHIANLPENPYV